MKIYCELADGQVIFGRDAGIVLLYWLGTTRPRLPLPKDAKPFEVYVVGAPTPGPDESELFITLVTAAIEAKFGCTPSTPNGIPEEVYWALLNWLRDHGNVRVLSTHADDDNSRELEVAMRILRRRD